MASRTQQEIEGSFRSFEQLGLTLLDYLSNQDMMMDMRRGCESAVGLVCLCSAFSGTDIHSEEFAHNFGYSWVEQYH